MAVVSVVVFHMWQRGIADWVLECSGQNVSTESTRKTAKRLERKERREEIKTEDKQHNIGLI